MSLIGGVATLTRGGDIETATLPDLQHAAVSSLYNEDYSNALEFTSLRVGGIDFAFNAAPENAEERQKSTDSENAPVLDIINGNIIDAQTGRKHVIRGAAINGAEYMCINGWQNQGDTMCFDQNIERLVDYLVEKDVNTIRLALNSHSWLGPEHPELSNLGINPELNGATYRRQIKDVVEMMNDRGLAVILDLHISEDPDSGKAVEQNNFIDEQTGLDFWQSMADEFGDNPAVMFELFNEPVGIPIEVWLNGGEFNDEQYIGYNPLIAALRERGAKNIFLISPLAWAHDVYQAIDNWPDDPLNKSILSFHSYAPHPQVEQWNSSLEAWKEITAYAQKNGIGILPTEAGVSQLDGKGDVKPDFTEMAAQFWLEQNGIVAFATNTSFPFAGHRILDKDCKVAPSFGVSEAVIANGILKEYGLNCSYKPTEIGEIFFDEYKVNIKYLNTIRRDQRLSNVE